MQDSKQMIKALMDEGKIIEAGFLGLRLAAINPSASPLQVEGMRNAFFAGAQHLFSCLLIALDPGSEPTESDLKKIRSIDVELREFIEGFARKHGLRR